MEGFYRRRNELLAEKKQELFQARPSLLGGRNCSRYYLFFFWELERAHVTDYLIDTEQKIPEQPVKITFLEKFKLQLSQVLNLGLVSWDFPFNSFNIKNF